MTVVNEITELVAELTGIHPVRAGREFGEELNVNDFNRSRNVAY